MGRYQASDPPPPFRCSVVVVFLMRSCQNTVCFYGCTFDDVVVGQGFSEERATGACSNKGQKIK